MHLKIEGDRGILIHRIFGIQVRKGRIIVHRFNGQSNCTGIDSSIKIAYHVCKAVGTVVIAIRCVNNFVIRDHCATMRRIRHAFNRDRFKPGVRCNIHVAIIGKDVNGRGYVFIECYRFVGCFRRVVHTIDRDRHGSRGAAAVAVAGRVGKTV